MMIWAKQKDVVINSDLLQQIVKEQDRARALEKPTCFLFNRVSTKLDTQETSLDQQEHDSYAYADKKGLHVACNFRVQETASKEEERHVFNQMIALLRSHLDGDDKEFLSVAMQAAAHG